MVNHIRTLLMNRHASAAAGLPGAEIVDPSFLPFGLPEVFIRVRNALLGRAGSGYQENCLLAYLMRLIHAPDLDVFAKRFDARVTYALSGDYIARLRESPPTVEAWKSADCGTGLYHSLVGGKWSGEAGIMVWEFSKRAGDDGKTVLMRYGSRPAGLQRVQFQGGVFSDSLTLLPDRLSVRFRDPAGTLTGEFRFRLSFSAPVELDVAAVLAELAGLDAAYAAAAAVFDSWDVFAGELAALQAVWDNSPEPALRLGAFVLAFAYQCERLRCGLPLPALTKGSTLKRIT